MHLLFSRITVSNYNEATYFSIFFQSAGDFVHIIIKHKFSHLFATYFTIQSRTQTIQYHITG